MISAEAARVGEELRASRLALGVSIEEMADHLRINRRYLAAIEEGRGDNLPAPAYALGFVRSYAQAMGLDAAELTRRFRDGVAPGAAARTDLVFPEPVPKRGVPAGAVILIGGVLAIGSYIAWWEWTGSNNRTVDEVQEPPARLETAQRDAAPVVPPSLGQTTPAPGAAGTPAAAVPPAGSPAPGPAGVPATGAGRGAVTPQPSPSATVAQPPAGTNPPQTPAGANLPQSTVAANAPQGRPTPGAPTQPAQGGAPAPVGPAPTAGTPAGPAAPAQTAAPAAPTTPAAPVQVEGQGRIVLRAAQGQGPGAEEGSWVQVRAKGSSRPLFSRVLRPGESYSVPMGEGMTLTTGKAEALEITVDGQASSALSGRTGVVRDLSLDPERLRASAPG
ncbi:helix-turn-helix domain-containing protein [Roseomonas elaeocarpi]|uniref:RodZ domain-containing protein n=1 Tax=Roseomonas elaeocarpi TaxID=907779 RepID=A0ABV6JUT6_9PROT